MKFTRFEIRVQQFSISQWPYFHLLEIQIQCRKARPTAPIENIFICISLDIHHIQNNIFRSFILTSIL